MRILIVDDYAPDAELLERPLKLNGCVTRKVDCLQMALLAVADFDPDLVLLDLNLRDAGPEQLRSTVTRLRRDGLLVVVTGLMNDFVIKLCNETPGVDALIEKNVLLRSPQLFFLRIKTLLLDQDEKNPRIKVIQKELSSMQSVKMGRATEEGYGVAQNDYLIRGIDKLFEYSGLHTHRLELIDARHAQEDKDHARYLSYGKWAVGLLGAIAVELAVAGILHLFGATKG